MKLARLGLLGGSAPPVLAVGTFDGLHIGHQALLARARELAAARGSAAGLLSFEPMPREFLRPDEPPARLTNFRERWRLLANSGLQALCLLRFSRTLQQFDGERFLGLLAAHGARQLVVGHDFRFGRGASASAEWMAQRGAELDVAVEIVAPVCSDGERVSSGAIRLALARGDFASATRWLGRPYTMRARVRHGRRLGRELGFATANLALHRRRAALAGIYAVRVHGAGVPSGWPAVASLGTRPTVRGVEPLLEVHLFDFADDLYGRELEVEFVAWLRDEEKFASLEAMIEQMHRDAAEARRVLGM